jgi:hypothetical protein
MNERKLSVTLLNLMTLTRQSLAMPHPRLPQRRIHTSTHISCTKHLWLTAGALPQECQSQVHIISPALTYISPSNFQVNSVLLRPRLHLPTRMVHPTRLSRPLLRQLYPSTGRKLLTPMILPYCPTSLAELRCRGPLTRHPRP